MIRVLQVMGGLNRGGAETMVMNFYKSMDLNEIQFDFITHDQEKMDYKDEIEKMGGKVYIFPKFKGYNIVTYRNTWKNFLKNHPEYKILHSHLRSYASIYFPIAKKYGLKTIIHSHSTSNGSGFESIVKYLLQKPLAKQADYLFACSKEAGEWLYGSDRINNDNYYLVKNSIDVNKYRYNEKIREEYRDKLNIHKNTVYGHVGRLSYPKNHKFLLKVFKDIVQNNEDAILLIIGDGELKDDIRSKIDELSLEDKVFMLGSRDDINCLLQALDFYLFPSLWEGLPVSVIEAQASGLQCLISDTITSEVRLTPYIKYLPIDKGTNIWMKEAIYADKKRFPEAADLVIKSGYDISTTANWLTKFYRGLCND